MCSYLSLHAPRRRGFTLVELLVVIGILSVLGAVAFGATTMGIEAAKRTREMTASRTLITAYLSANSDDGQLLAGYDTGVGTLSLPDGTKLSPAVVGERYPFRLAPYFNYAMEGTVLVNNNKNQIETLAPTGSSMHNYMISVFPALGMNSYFVGGERSASGTASYPVDCTTRPSQGSTSLLVFASAGTGTGSARVDGYFRISPPTLANWTTAKWTKDADPGLWGNVDARYSGKAVCTFMDGSVSMMSLDDLRDMRLWVKTAAQQNNSTYSDFH